MFTIGTIGFTGGNVIYYSFMPYLGSRDEQDKLSTWGYMFGFMGGSLLTHIPPDPTTPTLGWDMNFRLAVIFVTSALWWWGFGALIFKWTPEPEIPSELEWNSFGENNFKRVIGASKQRGVQDSNGNSKIQGSRILLTCLFVVL